MVTATCAHAIGSFAASTAGSFSHASLRPQHAPMRQAVGAAPCGPGRCQSSRPSRHCAASADRPCWQRPESSHPGSRAYAHARCLMKMYIRKSASLSCTCMCAALCCGPQNAQEPAQKLHYDTQGSKEACTAATPQAAGREAAHVYSSSTMGRVCPWQTSGICTRLAPLI